MSLRLILVLTAMTLAGCASTSFERTKAIQAGTEIQGSSVVVYSFLDVRKEQFGEQMLVMMNNQLVEQFKQRGVNARVIVYKQAEADAKPDALYLGVNRSMVRVPIQEYLAAQRPDEQKNGDKYRLMIFPSMITTTGAAIDSEINWMLSDIATDKPVWTTKQSMSRTVWWHSEEAPESRSKQFVDGVMGEMTKTGLFGAAALQQHQQLEDAKKKKRAS